MNGTLHLTGAAAIAAAFLLVSVIALLVQSVSFHQVRGARAAMLRRTAVCRVGCAVVYVLVGVNAIWGRHSTVASASLAAFTITQLTWMVNSRFDVKDGKNHMAYAPQAIQQLYAAIAARIPQSELGGIVGDAAHSFGYHLGRDQLPSTDYSVQLPLDRQGDPDAASALDVTYGLGSPWMITVTNRLLTAARAKDPRLAALREFCGTTDGQNTHPYDLSNGQDGPLNSWDSSHLFHVHLSIYRAYSNNYTAIAPIADVIAGISPTPVPQPIDEEADMADIVFNQSKPNEAAVVFGGKAVSLAHGSSVRGVEKSSGRAPIPLAPDDYARVVGALK